MTKNASLRAFLIGGLVALVVVGCGGVPPLPDTFDVATSGTEKSEAEKGSGPLGLANSTWSLTRAADPDEVADTGASDSTPPGPYGGLLSGDALERPPAGEQIFLVEFGDQGQMINVTENRFFLPRFYGSEVPIGGQWRGTPLPGVVFNSDSYGLEVGGRFGVAVIVHVRFGNLYLGQAILYSWGVQTDDTLTGTFGYLLDFTDGIMAGLGTIADQYPVTGQRASQ
jgi:hypothetical protein